MAPSPVQVAESGVAPEKIPQAAPSFLDSLLTSFAAPFGGAAANGIVGALGGGPPSGVNDTGLTNNASVNVVGNVTPNIGEILQTLNAGSAANGGFPTIRGTTFPDLLGTKPASVAPEFSASILGSQAKLSLSPLLIGVAAIGAVLILRRRT